MTSGHNGLQHTGYIVDTVKALYHTLTYQCGLVQWSPWEAMKECYQKFACVENAKFNSPAVVQPGESWRAQQEFAVIDL